MTKMDKKKSQAIQKEDQTIVCCNSCGCGVLFGFLQVEVNTMTIVSNFPPSRLFCTNCKTMVEWDEVPVADLPPVNNADEE